MEFPEKRTEYYLSVSVEQFHYYYYLAFYTHCIFYLSNNGKSLTAQKHTHESTQSLTQKPTCKRV